MKRAEAFKIRPLTTAEQKFAEENHDTVYRFLKWNHYPMEDYYTVVIEEYLRSCQIYLEREELQQYKFSTIAWKHMQTAVRNHWKAESTQKRHPEYGIISLSTLISAEYGDSGRCYEEIIKDMNTDIVQNIIRDEEDKVLMEKLWFFLSESQMEMVLFKMDGFSDRDICRHCGLRRKEYLSEMENIKEILSSVLNIR